MMNHQEQARLRRARTFDRAELTAIYDEYAPQLYRYIYRQIGEVETARDVTAQVFERFLQAIRQGHGPDQQLKAWLYRTAHNLVIDHYRRQQHRRHLPLDERLIDAADDPVGRAETHLTAAGVRSALQQLTPDQQLVITLKFLGQLSNAEVSAVLDKPISAIKSLQHRALAALQRQLAPVEEKV